MSSFNCCFLTCIHISQEAGQVVWYSSLEEFSTVYCNHTVKGFGIVNKAEIDIFLEFSCFFDDPADVGNLISGSSAFSKTSLNAFVSYLAQFRICCCCWVTKSSVTLCNPMEWKQTRLPCTSLFPWVCSDFCPLSQWCHPTISSSVTPFFSCPQSFPASGSLAMSWLSTSGG